VPPSTSLSQWAAKYVRLSIIDTAPSAANTQAQARPMSSAAATTNAAVLEACPEGYE